MTTIVNDSQEPLERQDERKLIDRGRKEVTKINKRLDALEVEYVKIDSVYPNAYNPNKQTEREFELLKKSIVEDGFTQPIVVHKGTKMIVDGEHRWRAMTQLGVEEIAVVFVEMSDEQMRISTLRHNRARGSEDIELSIDMLKDLRELGALDRAVDSLAIDDLELQALLSDVPAAMQMADEDFSEAWVPSDIIGIDQPEKVVGDRRVSSTGTAVDMLSDYKGRIEDADTHGHAAILEKEAARNTAMVTITFFKEDAALVRQVLTDTPADRLLELCVRYCLTFPEDHLDPYGPPEDFYITLAESIRDDRQTPAIAFAEGEYEKVSGDLNE